MNLRINSGLTYNSNVKFFSPVKKYQNNAKFLIKENSMNDVLHKHFSKYDLIQLDLFGEDIDNYGNIILNGISYHPTKIKLNYIKNRIIQEEKSENNFNKDDIINYEYDDDSKFEFINSSNRKLGKKNDNKPKINLPLLNKRKNQNKSMENIHNKKLYNINYNNFQQNKNINLNLTNKKKLKINSINSSKNDINEDLDYKNNSLNKNEFNNIEKDTIKKTIKNKNNKNNILFNKKNKFPILNNKINITNKNIKLFLQSNKLEVQTDNNRLNHILNRNLFLKRYDNAIEINKRLNKLNNKLKKVNDNICKVIDKNDEDIPQFNLRFNHLFKLLKV